MKKILVKAEDTIHSDTVQRALAKVKKDLRDLGEFLPETLNRATQMVKRDFAVRVARLGQSWEGSRIKRAEVLDILKDRGTHFLGHTSESLKKWMSRPRGKDE
jgi:hypothetical protein